MPSFMEKGERQMSTEAANTSRLVTKIRSVVESANARLKNWKYLGHILPSSQISFIGDYIKIVCSICNRYLKPLSIGNVDEDQALGAKNLYLSKQVNQLKEQVEEQHLDHRSVCWKEVNEVVDFPQLDEKRLRELTCESYQLRLSSSYAQEHIEGDCAIHMHKEEEGLLRIRMQSRHTSSKTYQLWIKYANWDIIAWYCKCRAGVRVVRMCAHTASIVWYLRFAWHRHDVNRIGVRDRREFLEDATAVDSSESVSDSSSDESTVEE